MIMCATDTHTHSALTHAEDRVLIGEVDGHLRALILVAEQLPYGGGELRLALRVEGVVRFALGVQQHHVVRVGADEVLSVRVTQVLTSAHIYCTTR